jgi:hypothetical protein
MDRVGCAGAMALGAALLWPCPLQAAVELEDDSPEAQLMGFYAASLSFTPVGPSDPGAAFSAGVELAGIPSLSEEDRTTTFAGAKVENTNFTPVLPRPRFRWRPGPGWLLEGTYVPAVHVFGMRPTMYGLAAARRLVTAPHGLALWGRIHYFSAEIEGPITCSHDAVEDPTNTVCFGGQASRDRFRPNVRGVELLLEAGRLGSERLAGYLGLGYRRERLRFLTDFVNVFGRKDDQILEATLDEVSYTAGLTWKARRDLRVTGEGFYAPGALVTAKFGVAWECGR